MAELDMLPDILVGNAELGKAQNQLDTVQDFFKKTSQRTPGTSVQLPTGTKLIEDVAKGLELNILTEADRQKLAEMLRALHKSPSIHISLASEPTAAMTAKLVSWLRALIDPKLLIDISVQPGIGAGAIVRTKNKQFDFSLRAHFAKNKELLIDYLSSNPAN